MSSNEDKKLIKFPGAKKELKQGHSYPKALGKENQTKDNVVPFLGANQANPLLTEREKHLEDVELYRTGIESRSPLDSSLQKTQDMSSPSASVGGGSPGSNKVNINESVDFTVIAKTDVNFWNRSSLKQGDSSSSGASTDEGESRKYKEPSYYVISSVACAVFLMLVGVSYFNVGKFSEEEKIEVGYFNVGRDLATGRLIKRHGVMLPITIKNKDGVEKKVFIYKDEKLVVDLIIKPNASGREPDSTTGDELEKGKNEEKLDTWKVRLNRQEKQMINLITTGQRRLASIGRKPGMKDRFSMEALKSRYNVRWSRGKLSSAKLLEGQEPVRFPSMDKVVKEYRTLFPHYYAFVKGKDRSDQIKLRDSLNLSSRELVLDDPDQREVYELRDRENSLVKKIVALRDAQSRLLSVYVVSD